MVRNLWSSPHNHQQRQLSLLRYNQPHHHNKHYITPCFVSSLAPPHVGPPLPSPHLDPPSRSLSDLHVHSPQPRVTRSRAPSSGLTQRRDLDFWSLTMEVQRCLFIIVLFMPMDSVRWGECLCGDV